MDAKLIGITDREGLHHQARDLTLETLDCDTALGFVFVSRNKRRSARRSGCAAC
jgi:hypothetical protein